MSQNWVRHELDLKWVKVELGMSSKSSVTENVWGKSWQQELQRYSEWVGDIELYTVHTSVHYWSTPMH